MAHKKILYKEDGSKAVMAGVNKVANAVKVTLGAKGRNAIISDPFHNLPHVTKDGITVARSIRLEDPIEDMGAQLVRNAAAKTVELAGDGTTTATVLTQEIANLGFKNVTAGANPMHVKRGIDEGVKDVVAYIKEIAIPVGEDNEKIKQIATISANNDEVIGRLISNAYAKIGRDGVLTLEEAQTPETTLQIVDGMQVDAGPVGDHFYTNPVKQVAEFSNPLILIYEKPISRMAELLNIMKHSVDKGRPLVIICGDMDGEAYGSMVMNVQHGRIKAAVVYAPYHGQKRKEALSDIGVLTGAMVLNDDLGHKLEEVKPEAVLGGAIKMVINKDSYTIVLGQGDPKKVEGRKKLIKDQIEESKNEYEREVLTERLAKLSGGVGVIQVGAKTEVEMKEKKDRVDDAIRATKAAIQEGIVAGGGTALVRAAMGMGRTFPEKEVQVGYDLVRQAIESPIKQMCMNAGENADGILQKVKDDPNVNFGYNVNTGVFEDLVLSGVIDPAKVVRVALENAASAASMIITSDVVLCDIETK